MKLNVDKYPETDELLENAADILLYIEYCQNNNSPVSKKEEILFARSESSIILFGTSENRYQKLSKFISDFELELIKQKKPNFQKAFANLIKKHKNKKLYPNDSYKIKQLIGYLSRRNISKGNRSNAFLSYKSSWMSRTQELLSILQGDSQTEDIKEAKKATAQSLSDNLEKPNKNEIDVYTDFEYDTETPGAITLVDMERNQFIYGGFIELEMEFMSIVGDPSEKTKEENNSALYKAIKKLDSQGKYSEDELNSITELFCTNHKKYLSQ